MPALSIMVKPASGLCNMKCKYCFYSDVVSHRKMGQFGVMSKDIADNLIEKAIAFADGHNISFVFQGGEPLLSGIEFFEHFIEYVNSFNYKGKIYYSLQTNGTLIDDTWGAFFKKNNFLIGVSLDGNAEHNKFRVMADNTPAFDKIERGIEILDKHKVDYNILSVVTGYFADNAVEIYNYFKQKGYKFLQFIPCLKPFGSNEESELYMTGKQYQNYLTKVFKVYANDFLNDNYISIRNFDNIVRLYGGVRPEQCGMLGACSHQFVVESNGNVYPCDFYCSDEWLLGNIKYSDFSMLFKSEKGLEFLKQSYEIDDKCKKCEYFKVCRGGGCKREKESLDYCKANKNFYKKSAVIFAKVLNKLKVNR